MVPITISTLALQTAQDSVVRLRARHVAASVQAVPGAEAAGRQRNGADQGRALRDEGARQQERRPGAGRGGAQEHPAEPSLRDSWC